MKGKNQSLMKKRKRLKEDIKNINGSDGVNKEEDKTKKLCVKIMKMHKIKKKKFFFNKYKMIKVSAETWGEKWHSYKNN